MSPDTTAKVAAAFKRRDAWLGRHADEAVVVWDQDDALVGKQIRTLQDELGEEEVWLVSPAEIS